ncbi:hypothetical protein GBA52_024155 [Prunus armeniaca]|nr:hypothetical protein GBA52_024155 [Prunus armeniaca]
MASASISRKRVLLHFQGTSMPCGNKQQDLPAPYCLQWSISLRRSTFGDDAATQMEISSRSTCSNTLKRPNT